MIILILHTKPFRLKITKITTRKSYIIHKIIIIIAYTIIIRLFLDQ